MSLFKSKLNSKIKPEKINRNISIDDIDDEKIRKNLKEYTIMINNYVSFINNLLKNNQKIDTANNLFNIYKEYKEDYWYGKMFVYNITWNFPLKKYEEIENGDSYLSFGYVIHVDILTKDRIGLETFKIKLTMPKFLNKEYIYFFENCYSYFENHDLELILNENNIINIILEIRKLKEIYELKSKLNGFSLSKLNKS